MRARSIVASILRNLKSHICFADASRVRAESASFGMDAGMKRVRSGSDLADVQTAQQRDGESDLSYNMRISGVHTDYILSEELQCEKGCCKATCCADEGTRKARMISGVLMWTTLIALFAWGAALYAGVDVGRWLQRRLG